MSSAPGGGSHCIFKRVHRASKEEYCAQDSLAKVQFKLQLEERGFIDGEARLAALIQESAEAGS